MSRQATYYVKAGALWTVYTWRKRYAIFDAVGTYRTRREARAHIAWVKKVWIPYLHA